MGRQLLLALLCVSAGVLALASRTFASDLQKLVVGLAAAALFLALAFFARARPALRRFWELPLAFFVFALVQVLNAAVQYAGVHVLHDPPVNGNPLASTVWGTVTVQVLETLVAIVPVLALTRATGQGWEAIYARTWRLGRGFLTAALVFVLVFLLVAIVHPHRLFPMNGTMTAGRLLALTPALLILVLSNGFQEEFLFRGLFLKKYEAFLGAWGANWLQAAIFTIAHVGVSYTPVIAIFALVFVLPLGLLAGYLMRRTDGVLVPAVVHAALDIPIYLAFLSYVS